MRRKNLRIAIVGVFLFFIAIAFYFLMLNTSSRSNDPVELLRIVGMVSGVVGGLAIAMILTGLIGKKF